MICPNCKRQTKTVTNQGFLRYRNKYGNDIAVPWWGEWCRECKHKFHTRLEEEIHNRAAKRMLKESEELKESWI